MSDDKPQRALVNAAHLCKLADEAIADLPGISLARHLLQVLKNGLEHGFRHPMGTCPLDDRPVVCYHRRSEYPFVVTIRTFADEEGTRYIAITWPQSQEVRRLEDARAFLESEFVWWMPTG